ncbi:hypothetical protein GGE50_003848 [Rhizobium leguminosarum]|uniref:hypothetical protein n=1 Tax=Rhizobium leguminosarum TaxID=384 RepID=UPI001613CB66|nr:hypothetical protein [Rhizobium leguminosarum]MBB4587944.1 hypothetical protein [Rhizobium leguminosarum]
MPRFVLLLFVLFLFGQADAAETEDCPISIIENPLPPDGITAAPSFFLPTPPVDNDCGFYNASWHEFLYVTQAGKIGETDPAFLGMPGVRDVFPTAYSAQVSADTLGRSSLSFDVQVRNPEPILDTDKRELKKSTTIDDGFTQAQKVGIGSVLVDINGNPIFYSVNVNETFKDFVESNKLNDIPRLFLPANDEAAVPTDLEFRPGSVELKASWMIVEGTAVDYSSYIVVDGHVPALKKITDPQGKETLAIDSSRPLRDVRLALLGLHVVEVLDGHPEFVWASFEHADGKGKRDVAPSAVANPIDDGSGPKTAALDDVNRDYPLFAKQSAIADSNDPRLPQQFDEATQKFLRSTPIFRIFPGSSDGPVDEAKTEWEDPAVSTLNRHIGERFDQIDRDHKDLRRNYRLVGAIWLNTPRNVKQDDSGKWTADFTAKTEFLNSDARLAGEKRLSNVAIESFTQPEASSPNCFSCHDTMKQNLALNGHAIAARRINVSHIFDMAARRYLELHPGEIK